ncbi:MAG: hypothetical protein CVU44_19400 [Chloroflexi bacterium HGW-Chloroflexi-6]|nr:MAG: hypothetical protein CVU44_19400 [Chloroflexi bacterium HGW-Chloroflexi-6]
MNGTLLLVAASAIWGVVHSLLASHAAKDLSTRTFGPAATGRFYRFGYNIFSVISFLPVLALLVILPDQPLYSIPAPWLYLSLLGQALAVVALVVGVIQTGVWEFIGLSQLIRAENAEKAQLTTSGLYHYVRHPLYSAGLVFIWLTPAMTLNRLALWIVMSLYLIIGAIFEERKLLRDFGQQYAEYKTRTPMLIPRLFG